MVEPRRQEGPLLAFPFCDLGSGTLPCVGTTPSGPGAASWPCLGCKQETRLSHEVLSNTGSALAYLLWQDFWYLPDSWCMQLLRNWPQTIIYDVISPARLSCLSLLQACYLLVACEWITFIALVCALSLLLFCPQKGTASEPWINSHGNWRMQIKFCSWTQD